MRNIMLPAIESLIDLDLGFVLDSPATAPCTALF